MIGHRRKWSEPSCYYKIIIKITTVTNLLHEASEIVQTGRRVSYDSRIRR